MKAPSANCVCLIPLPHPALPLPQREGEGLGLSRLCQECSCSRARQGERAACHPEGGWKGMRAARLGRGPPSLSPFPSCPSWQHGARWHRALCRGRPSAGAGAGTRCSAEEAHAGRGAAVCASSSSHDHSRRLRQLRNARPDPGAVSQEGGDGLPTCGGWWEGSEDRSRTGIPGHSVLHPGHSPWAQTSRPCSFGSCDVDN